MAKMPVRFRLPAPLKYYEKSSANEGFFCILGTILKSFKGINSKITSNTDEDVCL